MKHKAFILNGSYFAVDPIELDFPCEIHFTRFGSKQQKIYSNVNVYEKIDFFDELSYKVFISSNEPITSVNREEVNHIINNYFQYDLILTTDKDVLDNVPNSVLFPYGTTWLNKSKHHIDSVGTFDKSILKEIDKKTFNVSFVTTGRRNKEGYELRHSIWNNRDNIKIPTLFYSSTRDRTDIFNYSSTTHNGLLPNDDKINLFKSQFSIAIESTREQFYFTEKLIDCLLTKTVPVYWGATDIDQFFDTRGFIIINDYEDFLIKINEINENTYESLKPYIDYNFEKAKQYGQSFFSRIEDKIKEQYTEDASKKDILWTIGILTLPQRKDKLKRLLDLLHKTTPLRYKNRIEIIINEDDGKKSIGVKRQEVIDKAKGKYISFIDDDDMVSISYITKIADTLSLKNVDGVGFLGIFYYEGNPGLLFSHANKNKTHHLSECGKIQYRTLNHLNPVKTDIARQIKYLDISHGEDMDYSNKLFESNLIKSEYCIEEVLYHYLYVDKQNRNFI